ncbi:MAG: hypothetical protein FJ333_11345, partial [Sphingomonadales bacterium]|nr:hypothetical protein [Sphingomonadales bacterium]
MFIIRCQSSVCGWSISKGNIKLIEKNVVFVIVRVKTRIYAGGLLLLRMMVLPALSAQSVYINMGKGWSYITGAQRAVNDSNRVYYIM